MRRPDRKLSFPLLSFIITSANNVEVNRLKKRCLGLGIFMCLIALHPFKNLLAQSWQPLGPNDDNWPSFSGVDFPSLAFRGSTPYVVYRDWGNGCKATVKMFNGSIWVDVGTPGFSAGSAGYSSLAFDGGPLYVAYTDGTNEVNAILKMLIGTSWKAFANPTLSLFTHFELKLLFMRKLYLLLIANIIVLIISA